MDNHQMDTKIVRIMSGATEVCELMSRRPEHSGTGEARESPSEEVTFDLRPGKRK